ncbi:hypothetical protein [Halostagnicola bangensis]
MAEYHCPDCHVTMEETAIQSESGGALTADSDDGSAVLEKVGMSTSTAVESVRCPECGLVRLYADGN